MTMTKREPGAFCVLPSAKRVRGIVIVGTAKVWIEADTQEEVSTITAAVRAVGEKEQKP